MLPQYSNYYPSNEEATLNHIACLQYLRAHTSVPVPEVYDACATSKNPIGAPYILMQAIVGSNLLDQGIGLALNSIPDEHRLKLFHDVASIMAQVYSCRFPAIGRLGVCPSTGQFGVVSSHNSSGSPFSSAKDYYRSFARMVEIKFKDDQASSDAETKAQALFLPWIAKRMITDLQLGSEEFDRCLFPLSHGDLGFHNMILRDNYTIAGILDWEVLLPKHIVATVNISN
jgi:Phosphotransferase enzyme family